MVLIHRPLGYGPSTLPLRHPASTHTSLPIHRAHIAPVLTYRIMGKFGELANLANFTEDRQILKLSNIIAVVATPETPTRCSFAKYNTRQISPLQ